MMLPKISTSKAMTYVGAVGFFLVAAYQVGTGEQQEAYKTASLAVTLFGIAWTGHKVHDTVTNPPVVGPPAA